MKRKKAVKKPASKKTAIHFLNGKFVTERGLLVPATDLAFARGYGIFDFFITYDGQRPFKLGRHVDRLFRSAELIGLEMSWDKKQVEKWVLDTLAKNRDGKEKAVKIIVSGGVSNSLAQTSPATIAILVVDRHPNPPEWYTDGICVTAVNHRRYMPAAKTNNYIEAIRQIKLGRRFGAIEPLYYDEKQVFEGSNSNVFALIGGKLLTPKSNILEGITREVLLDILRLPVPVLVEDFTIEDLRKADEVFFTASNKEVVPVTRIDDKPVAGGKVGPVTKEVMRQFREFTLSDKW